MRETEDKPPPQFKTVIRIPQKSLHHCLTDSRDIGGTSPLVFRYLCRQRAGGIGGVALCYLGNNL